jgi:hypothetical protein
VVSLFPHYYSYANSELNENLSILRLSESHTSYPIIYFGIGPFKGLSSPGVKLASKIMKCIKTLYSVTFKSVIEHNIIYDTTNTDSLTFYRKTFTDKTP